MSKKKQRYEINKEPCALIENCESSKICDGYGTMKKRAGLNKKGTCSTYTTQSQLNLISRTSGIESRV
ncbi:MAG: hypothetical protein ACOC1P_05965 [Minisyncoccales bacterium]